MSKLGCNEWVRTAQDICPVIGQREIPSSIGGHIATGRQHKGAVVDDEMDLMGVSRLGMNTAVLHYVDHLLPRWVYMVLCVLFILSLLIVTI